VAAAFARPETPGSVLTDPTDPTNPPDRTNPHDPAEATLLDNLRVDDAWLPALSFVAVDPSTSAIIGHVVCTRAAVDTRPALGLGPLAVRPDRQRQGVGTALMHAVLGAADALDEPLVALLGDPEYYRRFDFHPSSVYGILPPNPQWGRYFQVRTLTAYRPMAGTFTYAGPFDLL
jgi:putative acetyltransferase